MLKILITFALDLEFAPWRRMHPFTRVAEMESTTHEAEFGDVQVRVALTGVGSMRAANVARMALKWQPRICIASGFAGSLRAECGIGQVLAARDIMELESGRTIAAEASLMSCAEVCGARIMDRLLTCSEMVLSADGKRRLSAMAGAVEMESFAVAKEAAGSNIPAIAIRAISDEVNEDLPMDFGQMLDESGHVNMGKIAGAVARAPHKIPALVRLGRNSRIAAANLAEFLERYVSKLASSAAPAKEMAEAHRS